MQLWEADPGSRQYLKWSPFWQQDNNGFVPLTIIKKGSMLNVAVVPDAGESLALVGSVKIFEIWI